MKKLLFVLCFIFSIQNIYSQPPDIRYELPEGVYERDLITNILKKGNINQYLMLHSYYFGNREPGAILPYALIMATKWNYPLAMLHVYFELIILYGCSFHKNIEIMDNYTRQMALNFLIMYYKNGEEDNQKESIRRDISKYIARGYIIEINGELLINNVLLQDNCVK